MAQNITLLGASYSDVPSVELPKTGGGTAQFNDTTDANATAADIALSKTAYVNGVKLVGTNQGGGGLEYEMGTWTPSEDTSDHTISFLNTHTTAPFYYMVSDAENNYEGNANTNLTMTMSNMYGVFGSGIWISASGQAYARGTYIYLTTTGNSAGGNNITALNAVENYMNNTGIRAYAVSALRYWRAGRTYKWIAVWAPTSSEPSCVTTRTFKTASLLQSGRAAAVSKSLRLNTNLSLLLFATSQLGLKRPITTCAKI